jgi:hypothetical protein
MVVSDAGRGFGTGSTQTEIVSIAEQPLASVTITLYNVLNNGFTVIVEFDVFNPIGIHSYEYGGVPLVALTLKPTLSPRQIQYELLYNLSILSDIDFSVSNTTVSIPMHPEEVYAVNVYVMENVLSGNVTKGRASLGLSKNVEGVHSYRNVSLGSAMTVGVRRNGATGLQMY